ncbi:sodium/proline symporter [Marinimicrobium sp. C6131]|uniref:sodium/proline symporter n=1 Tax=Marinimicrobium sp. C6131 TaxID=3022676 RepID=UPI00223CF55E|nr:sodium/proline symporter [Marinimicrobium sp. C6131]UZJ45371.1 sodium/proline symporter [Marinimicrobium sp. C6131]
MLIASFLFFLLVFVVIGALSVLASKHTTADYLTAGQSIRPWLVALSAVATNNSGYMFTGMIGFTYVNGLSSIWLMIGWIFGDYLGSLTLWRSIRDTTGKQDLHSFSGLISRWWGQRYHRLRALSGLLILIFLGTYAGAQLNAGSKALHVLLDWDLSTGAILGAVVVLIYSFAGGIRASIWTDAAQSMVMVVAMPLLMWMAMEHMGGWNSMMESLHDVEGGYMNWFPPGSTWYSAALFVLGWVFAGFGVVGQPHVMVRYMSLTDSKLINQVRAYYYSWFTFFYGATIVVGLLARLIITDADQFDSELALPTMAVELMPELLAGLVLAGLFAATMSTADSLVISCSATLSRDLRPNNPLGFLFTKFATLTVVVVALFIALYGEDSVFELVILAWGLLASAFAPLLLIYRFNRLPTEGQCITIMLSGVAAYLISHYTVIQEYVYELMPSMLIAFAVYGLIAAFGGVRVMRDES